MFTLPLLFVLVKVPYILLINFFLFICIYIDHTKFVVKSYNGNIYQIIDCVCERERVCVCGWVCGFERICWFGECVCMWVTHVCVLEGV